MAYRNLNDFIEELKKQDELIIVSEYVNTHLEISEITDRISKAPENRNKALLFTNNGTDYPLLINALGSQKRICTALNCNKLDDLKQRIETIFTQATSPKNTLKEKLSLLPLLAELKSWMPKHKNGRGECQEVIEKDVDLNKIPILQCWKHDAGKFITFPMVITEHPETHCRNMGMYRMQVIDKQTTGMHWHKNKTGEHHYEAYKRLGQKMPVSVALGGDPANIFSATAPLPENIDEQMLTGVETLSSRFKAKKFMAYFQAYTNTYATLDRLKEVYEPFIQRDDVIAICVATRSDCLDDENIAYLDSLTQYKDVWVEVGLQTIHDETSKHLNRGHDYACFLEAIDKLSKTNCKICVHIINGLPNETKDMMLDTVKAIAKLPIHAVKIHMLHLLKNTQLSKEYEKNPFHILTLEEYVEIVCEQLTYLPKEIVLERLTGDGIANDLITPLWTIKKVCVLNEIDKYMAKNNLYQGMNA